MVTIRLTRRGAKKQPFYHVVVTDSRARQGGMALEQVGYFNPIPAGKQQRLQLDLTRIDHWVSKGAKLSERVAELVSKHRRVAQVGAPAAVAA
jgi:small subunit ribosomal protein S16